MNRTIIIILALLLSISFTGQPLRSQVVPAKFKVAVVVEASKKEIHESIVESHIRSELRRLDDVEVVKYTSTFPEWELLINIHILESKYKTTGELTGDACISMDFFEKTNIGHFRPDSIDLFTKYPATFFPPLSTTYTWSTEKLDQLSKIIVNDFEMEVLEVHRKRKK